MLSEKLPPSQDASGFGLSQPTTICNALRFYQKRGFMLVAVHRNALELSRKLKPEIPLIGNDGIPLT